jgi:hypothetical protein
MPLLISETNLSRGWAKLLVEAVDTPGSKVSPVVLSLTGFNEAGMPAEIPELRQAMDTALAAKEKLDVEGVAYTIFPQRLWQIAQGDRARLFHLYSKTFPRYKAMRKRENGRGLYFERLTMFDDQAPSNGNQLEWILSQYASRVGVRRSMFQATTFDPRRDHVANARLNFPCLQQVSFVPTEAGLVVNAFYATQYVFDKAYGNYLGLAHLGAFMADQMNLPLARLNVTIGVANFALTKSDGALAPLLKVARQVLLPVSAETTPAIAAIGA